MRHFFAGALAALALVAVSEKRAHAQVEVYGYDDFIGARGIWVQSPNSTMEWNPYFWNYDGTSSQRLSTFPQPPFSSTRNWTYPSLDLSYVHIQPVYGTPYASAYLTLPSDQWSKIQEVVFYDYDGDGQYDDDVYFWEPETVPRDTQRIYFSDARYHRLVLLIWPVNAAGQQIGVHRTISMGW